VKPSFWSSTARVVSSPVSKTSTPGTRILTATIKPLRAASRATRTVVRVGSRMYGSLNRRLTTTLMIPATRPATAVAIAARFSRAGAPAAPRDEVVEVISLTSCWMSGAASLAVLAPDNWFRVPWTDDCKLVRAAVGSVVCLFATISLLAMGFANVETAVKVMKVTK